MKSLLSRIPEKLRRIFYVLPLFVQWIVGVSLDESEAARAAARRAMVLGLFFLLGISLLYVTQQTLSYLSAGQLDYYLGWGVFGMHAVLAGLYWIGSLWLVLRETGSNAAPGRLDALADRIEKRLSV